MSASRTRVPLDLVAVLLVAAALRVWWFRFVDTQPVTDFDWYFERAVSIATGHGYAVNGGATAYWPVGYPAFLGVFFKLFGASVGLAKTLNAVLVVCTIGLSWWLTKQLFQSRLVATLTALVLAIHPAFLAYSGILASEPLYTALTLLAIALLASAGPTKSRTLFAGLAFGCATLVRPQAIVIPAFVVACLALWDARELMKGRTLKALLMVYLGTAVVLFPWTVRNYRTFGHFIFVSTNGGDNLLIGNSPYSDGKYQNPTQLGVDFTGLSEVERDRAARQAALAYIREHQGAIRRLWPTKLATTFLSGTDTSYWAFQTEKGHMKDPGTGDDKPQFKGFREYGVKFTVTLFWASVAGVLASLATLKAGTKLPILGLALAGLTAGLSMVFFGNPRFAFPIVPFLAMYAMNSVQALVNGAKFIVASRKS